MPIEKNNDLPAGNTDVEIEDVMTEDMPDIEVVLDDEGGAEVNIGEEEDEAVPFDANLAEGPRSRSLAADQLRTHASV
jgi:hypothetical protein